MIRKFKIFLEMIKFEHTLFALPFAFMGALLGTVTTLNRLPTWTQIGWIVLAMVGARSAAMGLNRVIDRMIDKKNPRTSGRAIPAGLLSSTEVYWFIAISLVVLFFATAQLDPLATKLMPIAVFMLVAYSYTKRFTWTCHIILGLTVGLAALGSWVAVTGVVNATALIFYVSVSFWIAGFDVIYACQDIEFDRKEGLYSIPSRFGLSNALNVARLFHLITGMGLISLFFLTQLSWWYFAGVVVSYLILWYEHRIVSPRDLSRLNTAFFTMNGVLSIVMFCFTMVDLFIQYLW